VDRPPAPATAPVALHPVDRRDRAVLGNLGQLYRHDLSESLRHLPNDDGTFNNRRLDRFLAEADPVVRAWLIVVAGRLGGFCMRARTEAGGSSVHDFFVVRALRRTGVGREAARLLIATAPGAWEIGFQPYNPGVERFWSQVATDAVGDRWSVHDARSPELRPADRFITFTTG
jgi:predicted acetyltransferase